MSFQLEDQLKERLHAKVLEKLNSSKTTSCISNTFAYKINDEENIFVKTNSSLVGSTMFQGEYESLKAITSTRTIRAPKPRLVLHDFDSKQTSAIVMEFLDIKALKNECAKTLGQNLANLHDYNNKLIRFNERAAKWVGRMPPAAKHLIQLKAQLFDATDDHEDKEQLDEELEEKNQFSKHSMNIVGKRSAVLERNSTECDNFYEDRFVPEPDTEEAKQFGFDVSTSCGLIPQVNEWNDDWISFFARHRLDKPIRSLLSDHGDRELSQQWSYLQLKVDKFFKDINQKNKKSKIVPALLHGDLWSGNVAQLADESHGVVYDPSSFYGHSEYDFGIVRMFGGIPKVFEEAYFEILPKEKLFETRNKLYQLFHHLNHWDHFGSGYRSSTLKIFKDLNSLVV